MILEYLQEKMELIRGKMTSEAFKTFEQQIWHIFTSRSDVVSRDLDIQAMVEAHL